MKKHFLFMLPVVTLLAAALLSSCSSSDDDVTGGTDPVKPEPALIHFTAQLGSKDSGANQAKPIDLSFDADGTQISVDEASGPRRVVSDPDNGTLTAAWAENEKVALIYEVSSTKYICEATVTSVSSGEATIDGTLTGGPADNTPVKIVYPYAAADKDTDSGIKADYLKSGQDGTLSTLSASYDVAVGSGNLAVSGTGTDASLKEMASLTNQYAICKFSFRQSGTAITGITTLKVGDMLVRGTGLSSVYVAFDPSVSGVKRFTVINGTSTYTGTASPSLQAGMFYRPTINLNASGHALVDLGLPSGTLWATTNVGATSPEGYGDYFAWGETEPYYSSQSPLTWKTGKTAGYQWASYTKFGTHDLHASPDYGFTKYNNTNGPTTLDAVDDAATANWGSAWRMPKHEEWQELADNCYWEWTTSYNGVAGYIVYEAKNAAHKGKMKGSSGTVYDISSGSEVGLISGYTTNDTHIFLPAAGYRNGTGLFYQGSRGLYWSSSLDSRYSNGAWNLHFDGGLVNADNGSSYRLAGLPVRAVCAQ